MALIIGFEFNFIRVPLVRLQEGNLYEETKKSIARYNYVGPSILHQFSKSFGGLPIAVISCILLFLPQEDFLSSQWRGDMDSCESARYPAICLHKATADAINVQWSISMHHHNTIPFSAL